MTKGYTAAQGNAASNSTTVRQCMLDRMHGNGTDVDGISAGLCDRLICHTKRVLNGWIIESPKLKALVEGIANPTVDDLTAARRAAYGPIAQAARAQRRRRAASAAAADDDGLVDDDEDEDVDPLGVGDADGDDEDGEQLVAAPDPTAASASASGSAPP